MRNRTGRVFSSMAAGELHRRRFGDLSGRLGLIHLAMLEEEQKMGKTFLSEEAYGGNKHSSSSRHFSEREEHRAHGGFATRPPACALNRRLRIGEVQAHAASRVRRVGLANQATQALARCRRRR